MCKAGTVNGFTLLELSIVLVIIGLLIGAVLVGKDLMHSSQEQSVIAQIRNYSTAAAAFEQKYGALPGDIPDPGATKFGLVPRGQYGGQGDGDGTISGNYNNAPNAYGWGYQYQGETCMFWRDLNTVNMIPGNFNSCMPTSSPVAYGAATLDQFLPLAKIGRGNHIYVWGMANENYFSIAPGVPGQTYPNTGLTVTEAYNIDRKIDDGLPQQGNVQAFYLQIFMIWYSGPTTGFTTTATPPSATSCFDNGNTDGAQQHYSVTFNSGKGLNCSLSFHLQ